MLYSNLSYSTKLSSKLPYFIPIRLPDIHEEQRVNIIRINMKILYPLRETIQIRNFLLIRLKLLIPS